MQALPRSLPRAAPSALEHALVAGGDDRSMLRAGYRNKYNVSPWPLPASALFRGSCTCNPPTQRGYLAAQGLFDNFGDYADATRSIRQRLARAFGIQNAALFLCPSGSDAEFVPVAVAQSLAPGKELINVVTQHMEIGAGSAPAANLQYFSASTPLGASKIVGNRLSDSVDIRLAAVPARDADGVPVDTANLREALITEFLQKNTSGFAIAHSVVGGKTGLRDVVLDSNSTRGVLGVVDACQGRFTNAELQNWLAKDNIVLLTGSKFYRGPPFSAAVVVPHSLLSGARQAPPPPLVSHLADFLCPDDLPDEVETWKRALPDRENKGLALRWEAALAEIENSDTYDVETAEAWASQVAQMVPAETMECFDVRRCIVSLRVRASARDPWFDSARLRKLYDWLTLDVSSILPDAPAATRNCSIGQPVQVAETSGVLRLALGVDSLDDYAADPRAALQQDALILGKLHHLAANYTTVLQNEDKLTDAVN